MKNPRSKDENQQQTSGSGIEPHWWEVTAPTTAPPLLPKGKKLCASNKDDTRYCGFSLIFISFLYLFNSGLFQSRRGTCC